MRPLLLALLVFVAACETRPKATDTTPNADSAAVDLNKMPASDAPRSAADRVVRALYFEHDTEESPFLTPGNAPLSEQYFTKTTAALVQAKAAKLGKAKRHATNPLYNVPDNSITKMWVLPANVAGDKAVVFVTYVDAATGKAQSMRCEMAHIETGRWRVADIVYADGKRLTEVLK
jgi:hypothetical protein